MLPVCAYDCFKKQKGSVWRTLQIIRWSMDLSCPCQGQRRCRRGRRRLRNRPYAVIVLLLFFFLNAKVKSLHEWSGMRRGLWLCFNYFASPGLLESHEYLISCCCCFVKAAQKSYHQDEKNREIHSHWCLHQVDFDRKRKLVSKLGPQMRQRDRQRFLPAAFAAWLIRKHEKSPDRSGRQMNETEKKIRHISYREWPTPSLRVLYHRILKQLKEADTWGWLCAITVEQQTHLLPVLCFANFFLHFCSATVFEIEID